MGRGALYDRLVEGRGLPALAISIAAGITLTLAWHRRYECARYGAALAVAAIVAGWALAQAPVFLRRHRPARNGAVISASTRGLLARLAVACVLAGVGLTIIAEAAALGARSRSHVPPRLHRARLPGRATARHPEVWAERAEHRTLTADTARSPRR